MRRDNAANSRNFNDNEKSWRLQVRRRHLGAG
jgi:hypothetical protein